MSKVIPNDTLGVLFNRIFESRLMGYNNKITAIETTAIRGDRVCNCLVNVERLSHSNIL